MLDPDHLAALGAVLRLGSFAAAARELHVTPSAVAQRIRALDDQVGTSLVYRAQPCVGTAAGKRLAQHAEDVALLESQVARELSFGGDQRPTRVRIAVNADSLATWFIEAMANAGELLFELQIDDQDHSAEWLRRGEVSAAVTSHGEAVPGCIAEKLGGLSYAAVASPAFVKKWFPEGIGEDALGQAPCLTYDSKDELQRRWLCRCFGENIAPPSHYIPSAQAFLDATIAGLGWSLNPVPLVEPLLQDGALVRLVEGTDLHVPLSWQVSRVLAPALAELTAAVRGAAKAGLES